MIKARVVNKFTCISTNKTREIGDIVIYTKERAKEIITTGNFIEILESLPEPKAETQTPAPKKTRQPRKPKL